MESCYKLKHLVVWNIEQKFTNFGIFGLMHIVLLCIVLLMHI